jgi:transcription initiation factor TFIIH subunit 1
MSLSRAKGAAQYKKQDGEVSLSANGKSIIWTPNTRGGVVAVTIATEHLTNLQQTPATSAKAVLKVQVQAPGASGAENYVFTFSSPSTARDELNAFIEPLKKVMETQRSSAVSAIVSPNPAPVNTNQGQSGSMTMASTTSSSAKNAVQDDYSDAQLLSNVAYQKALIEQNPSLRERLAQAMRDKPASMTTSQLSKQFWTSRIHLLRAHAAEQAQKKGEYNVIADIKQVRHPDGKMRYDFTPAKFRIIFTQYPFMVKVHNELFKKKVFATEEDFWGDWINSRLYKKMKGERITEQDFDHPNFDRYLDLVDTAARPRHFTVDHVPRFIDMEGNESNHSQQKGNAPDFTMKPAFNGRNPILNTLNNMSERLLMNVAPSDGDSHGPAGVDEETYNELLLRDLQRNDKDNRVVLDIADQRKIAPSQDVNGTSELDVANVAKAIQKIQANVGLKPVLPTEIEEDEEPLAMDATTSMIKSIRLKASHSTPDQIAQSNISTRTKDSAVMAHGTTIDFLHYFWGAYLSGDLTRAEDVKFLFETLQNSQGRFDAVASQAEQERQTQLEQIQGMEKDMPASKRRRIDRSRLPGGKQAVHDMLAATKQAVNFAEKEYQRTLAKQAAQQESTAVAVS